LIFAGYENGLQECNHGIVEHLGDSRRRSRGSGEPEVPYLAIDIMLEKI
jgi:hypothetical protein